MEPRDVARVDQITACLREADGRPIPSPVLFMALSRPGRHTWSYPETLELLDELRILALISAADACCPHHAAWTLPQDR